MPDSGKYEELLSKILHEQQGAIPVLVNPHFLRSRGAGQLDIVYLQQKKAEWLLYAVEVKGQGFITALQKARIFKAGKLLGLLLDRSVQVYGAKYCKEFLPNRVGPFTFKLWEMTKISFTQI